MGFLELLVVLMAIFVIGALLILVFVLRIFLPLAFLLGFVLMGLSLFALYFGSIIWAYLDAQARGKPGWALALFVAFSPFFALIGWPLSLLAWIVFRPEKTAVCKNVGPDPMAGTMGHA